MPKLSDEQLREWYARFSKEVYEKAQIDVTRKEDLGRIKNFEIKRWDSEHLDEVEVELSYAYMPGDVKAAPDVTEFDAYSKWMMKNLNPNMNVARLQKLYDQSCNGTLMIFQPGGGTHQSCQVYTDQYGEIHTSLPIDVQDPGSNVEIPADQMIPLPPKYVKEPHPRDYYPGYPQEPVPPKNMNPSFLSWLGYILGSWLGIETDYGKLVRYQKEKEEYPKTVDKWLFDLSKQPGEAAEYRKAQEARLEYQTEAAEYQQNHQGKHYAIDYFIRYSLPMRDDGDEFVQLLENERTFLQQQHEELQEKQEAALKEESHGANEMLRYPKRTDYVLRNLVGHAPQPDNLTEWIELNTFKAGDYKPEPYALPKSAGYENMSPEEQAADQKKWAELAEIAGFAAVANPEVMGKNMRPGGFTEEENAELRYSMILNDLITKGRPNGKQHMDVLEPARQKAKEALDAYAANDPEPLAKLLVRSIQLTNREARSITTHNNNSEHAIDTVHLISRLYNTLNGILGGDPKRMESLGLNQQDLDETLGNVAFYEILTRNYEAKQKLIEYGNGQRNLSEEELLEAGKDMLFSAMVSKEHSLFHDQESARIVVSPEQAENLARLGAVNEYIQLLRDIPKVEAKGETERLQKLKERQTKLQEKYGFGSGKFTMEEEHRIATGKLNLRDNDRAPYPINQELRNPNYVKTFRDQLAEKANLRILMAGRRELVLKTFAIKESVSELADKALGLLVKEEQKKEAAKPVKDAQLSKNEQLEQNQQKEIQSTLIS